MTDSTTMSIMSKGNETCREIPADVSKTVNLIFINYFIRVFKKYFYRIFNGLNTL